MYTKKLHFRDLFTVNLMFTYISLPGMSDLLIFLSIFTCFLPVEVQRMRIIFIYG